MRWTAVALALVLTGCRTAGAKPDGTDVSAGAAAAAPLHVSSNVRQTFQKSLELARAGDLLNAERGFQNILQAEPQLDYVWTNLGVVLERKGQPQNAEAAYRRAVAIAPDQGLAWEYLVHLLCRTGRAADAEALARAQLEAHPAARSIRNARIFVLLVQDRRDAAAAEAKKVLKADERNVRAMQLLAKVYYVDQKYELAKMVLENARAIDANDAPTHNLLGLTQLKLKNPAAALESFKTAAALQPDFAEALNNCGALLNEAQDYDGAAKALEAAVRAAPDFAEARLNLGNAYRGRQDFSRALAEYQTVVRLDPARADAYYNLAILHLDSELPAQDSVDRYQASLGYFALYRQKGGNDERVDEYVNDAHKGIEREQRRRERERKERLKKAPVGGPPTAHPKAPAGKVSGEEK